MEFKREMGSDKKYSNENMSRNITLQKNFLQSLERVESLINDETVNSVVITVPAMFTAIQRMQQ